MDRNEVKNLFLMEVEKLEGKILEIGYGKPDFFEKYSKTAEVYGVEFSTKVLNETKLFLSKHIESKRVKIYRASSDELPFFDCNFDFIVLSFCFCCLIKPRKIVSEIHRVGKGQGQIISFDHIRSEGWLGVFLDISTPLYSYIHKNCHLNRNPLNYFNKSNIVVTAQIKSSEKFIPWLFTKSVICK